MLETTIKQPGELGAEVFRCRRRRRSSVHVDLFGLGGCVQLILLPPLLALFVTGLVVVAVAKIFDPHGQNIPLVAALAGLVVTITVALYIYLFSTPEDPQFVLHENGFRYKRRKIPFSRLAGIAIGQDSSMMGELAQGLGSLMAWHRASRIVEKSARASVTLFLDDRSTLALKNVLVENSSEDLNALFEIVRRDHPQIHFL